MIIERLTYNLCIPDRKAIIDNGMEYALQLIEQGKMILSNWPNEDTEEEE
jgi:hemin uptake protein HemP